MTANPIPYPYLSQEDTTKGYKLCTQCGCPILRKGQKRKHPDDYRHANGCPNDDHPHNPHKQPHINIIDINKLKK